MMIKPALKYWIFLIATAAAIFAVILGSFAGSWFSLSPEEQALLRRIFSKLIPFPFLGAIILLMIIGTLVSLLFSYYIIPVLQLAEKARLITTVNPAYRIVPTGAREVIYLTQVINDSAEAFQRLQLEVEERIRSARRELDEERNRLAALMSELPGGVLVCNTAGRILLYNRDAQKLLQSARASAQPGAWIGLGRSIFGVLDRDPIVHALARQQQAASQGQTVPPSSFLTTLRSGTCLRVNMAPVSRHGEGREEISGFVLTLEDMTRQIEAETHRDLILRSLTEGLQEALREIRRSISSILAGDRLTPGQLHRYRQTIDRASQRIEQQLSRAREDYLKKLAQLSQAEDVLAGDLLQLIQNTIRERSGIDVSGRAAAGMWLRVDIFSFLQAVSDLAERLQDQGDLSALALHLKKSGPDQAALIISWQNQRMPRQLIVDWENAPLITDSHGRTLSFHDLVSRHGGTVHLDILDSEICRGIELLLPSAPAAEHLEIEPPVKARPVYYEFDLFNQTVETELGLCLLRDLTYVVFDTETTGLSPTEGDEIIQIGAIRLVKGRLLFDETIDQLIDPQRSIPASSVAIHGIEPEMLREQPTIEQFLPYFRTFAEGAVLVAHNAAFDMRFLNLKRLQTGVTFDQPVLDTLLLSSIVHPSLGTHSLDEIAERLNIPVLGRHTALGDAIVTAEILLKLIPLLELQGIRTLDDALEASAKSPYARLEF